MTKLRLIIFASLILAVFFNFLRIDIWDPDFWWHIATGRDIVNTGSLPDKDIFSHPLGMEENKNLHPERENFILKQYWLGQIIFYLLFEYMGPGGIIFLRSLLFSLIVFFVLFMLHRWSVSTAVSFLAAFALFMMFLTRLTGDRPVLFTYLFTAVTFFILEDFRNKKDKRIFLLLPLMLLWSNLHGGFIVGVIIISVFMVSEGVKIALKKAEYKREEVFVFYVASVMALVVSFINPTAWDAFVIAISEKYKPFVLGVQEYDSPFLVFFKEKLSPVDYWYLALAALFPLVLILRNRKFDITHAILLSGFFIMSISALRFIVYYEILAVMIIGREFDAWLKDVFSARFSKETYTRLMNWLAIAACFSLLIFVVSLYGTKDKRFRSYRSLVPNAAVDFVENNKLKGNMFNDYAYGGYLAWRLYPWKKTFIDTRALSLTVMMEYNAIGTAENSLYGPEPSKTKGPLWERLLEHYKINFVFLGYHDIHGLVLPIILKLAESDKWVPVYCDPMAVIFVRNSDQNSDVIEKFRISKDFVYDALIYRSAILAMVNRVSPRALISLGETFYRMGRLEDALTAYRYSVKRLPFPQIEEKIKMIESELKAKEKKEI